MPSDAGPDTPMSDGPACKAFTDGGDLHGACCPDGTTDIDSDGDGVFDCNDPCSGDPNKVDPGVCGCFVADTDTDKDGTLDCMDGCPKDKTRTMPGPCGCGVPDDRALCLAHRYSFNDVSSPTDGGAGDAGAGATVLDSVGGANGTAIGVSLTGNGSVTLTGGVSGPHIVLPAGIISSLGNSATFEVWVTWTGSGGVWQRIFDFGDSNNGPGNQGTGTSWIFLTPQGGAGATNGVAGVSMVSPGALTEEGALAILTPASMQHLAVVVDSVGAGSDAGGPNLSLYINGALASRVTLGSTLSTIDDANNWLGQSQFSPDPGFNGTLHEVRIYSAARTAAQIQASFAAGPDTLPAQ
jgi:hypothetical protein